MINPIISDVSQEHRLNAGITMNMLFEAEAGLALRLDERGDSRYFMTLAPAEKKLRFFKRTISGSSIASTRGTAAFSDELIQERKLPHLGEDRFYEIKVLVKGEFCEIIPRR